MLNRDRSADAGPPVLNGRFLVAPSYPFAPAPPARPAASREPPRPRLESFVVTTGEIPPRHVAGRP